VWWVVDRIEGRYAVLVSDAGQESVVPKKAFREGRVYWWDGRYLRRSKAEESRRRMNVRARLDRLRARDPGGDIQIP
jgi:DUF3006 family protein